MTVRSTRRYNGTYQSATFLYANYDQTNSHNETPVHALEKAMSLIFLRITSNYNLTNC